MLITVARPKDTVRWFELKDQQHEILCVLLAADPRHRAVLKELIENFIDSDVALGKKVGFLIVGEAEAMRRMSNGGGAIFFPGELLGGSVMPLRDVMTRQDAAEASMAADMLAQSSVSAVTEWLSLVGIQRGELPALCVLIKGTEPVVIPLGPELTGVTVRRVLGQLADIAHRDIRSAAIESDRLREVVRIAEQAQRDCEALKGELATQLEAVCNHFRASSSERQAVVQFLAADRFDDESLETLFGQLPFAQTDKFSRSSSVRGVRNKARRICEARSAIHSFMPTNTQIEALVSALRIFQERRDETRTLVAQLNREGVKAKEAPGARFDLITKRARSAADIAGLLEKAGNLLSWVRGLDWPRVG